jgi:hypothetical protein
MNMPYSPLMDAESAARCLGLKPRTLELWRWAGRGPQFVRVSSRCVRYRTEDLNSWLRTRVVDPTEHIPETAEKKCTTGVAERGRVAS